MTDPMMRLQTLLEKSSDADLLRGMIGFAARWQSRHGALHQPGWVDFLQRQESRRCQAHRRLTSWRAKRRSHRLLSAFPLPDRTSPAMR